MKRCALLVLASLAATLPAQALNVRTWVSGKGTDQVGCGPVATPCRTLQYAHDATSPNGEVDVLDSAGYGSLVIAKALTITSEAAFAGVLGTSNAPAIRIAAGSTDRVVLRGLAIQGVGVTESGVLYVSGGGLTIERCTLSGFTGSGVRGKTSTSGRIQITDSAFSANGNGILVDPTLATGSASIQMAFDRLTMTDNKTGIRIIGSAMTSTSSMRAALTNSVIAGSRDDGFGSGISVESSAGQANVRAIVEATAISDADRGVFASGTGAVYVGRSSLFGNARAFSNNGAGALFTYGDNHVAGNDLVGSTPAAVAPL